MVMRLAVGQAALLVMAVSKERFLTLGAYKVLHVPVLAQRSDYSLLDRTTTGTANRNAHLVVASQAIQFIQVVRCVSRTALHLTRR